jgi:hypothetical protein
LLLPVFLVLSLLTLLAPCSSSLRKKKIRIKTCKKRRAGKKKTHEEKAKATGKRVGVGR